MHEEFVGLRDYRPGDPIQRIHWKSFARVGNPVVREYQDEFFERRALILDTFSAHRDPEAFEEAVSVAASFACTLDTQESLLDLLFVGEQSHCYTAGRGQLPAGHLLEVLAGVRACADKPFESLAQSVFARRVELSAAIVILLAWDEPRSELVRRLRAGGVPTLALLVAAEAPPDRPALLHLLQPGRIQEGLARL